MDQATLTRSLLYLDGVDVSFDGFKALHGLSLTLEPGEMRAIIGPNGAGKTTMMDVITGKTRPDDGRRLFRRLARPDATRRSRHRRARHRPQIPEADGVRKPHASRTNPVGAEGDRVRRPPRCSDAPRGDQQARIDAFWKPYGLTDHRNRSPADLSHGQKQWLEIGMLLAQDPKLLLVDEPVAGMTDAETVQTASCSRPSPGIIRSSSSSTTWISCASSACKVTVLHEGSVLAEGPIDAVSADPRVVEVYLGR